MRLVGVVAMLVSPLLLSSCFGCPPGSVGQGCVENAIQVTNLTDEGIVIVVDNPASEQSQHWVPRGGSGILYPGAGACLPGPIEVHAPGGEPGEAVPGERIGQLDTACTGDQRTWWGDERDNRDES